MDAVNDVRWTDIDSDGATYEPGSEVTQPITAGEMYQPCKDIADIARERQRERAEKS